MASLNKLNINMTTSEVGFGVTERENSFNKNNQMSESNEQSEDNENNDNNENNENNETNSELLMNKECAKDEAKWRYILEMQNKNFLEIIKTMKSDGSRKSEQNKLLSLPKFDPENVGSDAVAWCSTTELILEEHPVEGSALIMALTNCLHGSASQWLPTICYSGIKWIDFKDMFIQRFGGTETSAATIMNMLTSKPNANENLSAFASRLVTSLMSRWQNTSKEEIVTSLVLARVAQIDNRVQHMLFTNKISSRNELQQELKAFAYAKRHENRETTDELHRDSKRLKLMTNLKCHHCGKTGHKIADCRSKQNFERSNTNAVSVPLKRKTQLICYRCGQPGHIATRCSLNDGEINKKVKEKIVNVCSIEPLGTLEHNGESFSFCFDTGAECSLIKETLSLKFCGKRSHKVVYIRGIGNKITYSTVQILCSVKINDIVFEILFHVMPVDSMRFDVIVGREVVGHGIGVEFTATELTFFRNKSVNACSKINETFPIDKIDTDLVGKDKEKLLSILYDFSNYFINGIPHTRISTGELEIRLNNPNKLVQRRPYRLGEHERQIVRSKIKELMEAKIIRPSCSPFASPILLVKKKDGSDRMCVDYRELNANTVSDKYPLPLISEQIARLRGATCFTCLDMASGYHQVPVHENSIEMTAFVTPDGQYEYLTMPFGLKNAPSVFQRAVMKALGDLAYSFAIVYMDDIMITATTQEEALSRLRIVLDTLAKAGFSFNIGKCSFLKTSVEYLGYEIKAGEIRPNARKIKALVQLPPPQSVTQLRQFIGLASYFRKFINKFSEIMKPLYSLTSSKKFVWKPEHERIRSMVVEILSKEPVLMIFDPKYSIELHTDACADGFGAILLQKVDNSLRVVEYFSKKTTDVESRYHSYVLETLAVVNSVKYFRHYLIGRKFVVYTDCNALKATRNKIELTPRVQRWWAYLQTFDFEIVYREGKRMAHADFFSRNHIPVKDSRFDKIEQKHVQLAEISNEWLLAEQQKDNEIVSILKKS